MTSGVRHWYQRRARTHYVAPRQSFTVEQRLSALDEIAARAERGQATPADELEAAAHMAALGRTLQVLLIPNGMDPDDKVGYGTF